MIFPSLSSHLNGSYARGNFFSFSRIAHCLVFVTGAPREDISEGPGVLFRGGIL